MTIPGSRLEKLQHLRRRIDDEIRQELANHPRPRPRATPADPTSTHARLAALGITSVQVKRWAVEQGLLAEVKQGRLAARLLNAYLDAHPQEAAR